MSPNPDLIREITETVRNDLTTTLQKSTPSGPESAPSDLENDDNAREDRPSHELAEAEKSSPDTKAGAVETPLGAAEDKSDELDDAQSGAETSEGENIDFFDEKWRKKYHELKKRVKMTPKRAKQMYQYASIMEERVTFLEERCDDMAKRLKIKLDNGEELGGDNENAQRPLKFSLNHQLWLDFKVCPDKESTVHVIDILVEEPQYLEEDGFELRRRDEAEYAAMESFATIEQTIPKARARPQANAIELSNAIESLRGYRLPERIRFNSRALQHLLRRHFHSGSTKDRLFTDGEYMMLRPFKALALFEDEIRELWNRLSKILDDMRLAGNSQGNNGSQDTATESQNEATKAGCQQDPNQPMNIDKDTWTSVLKRLGLFHSDESNQFIESEWSTDEKVKKTFGCLLKFIDEYLKPITSRLRERKTDKVRFEDLWHLFQTDDEIVTRHGSDTGKVMGMRVLRTGGGRRHIHPGSAPSFDSTPLPKDRPQPVNGMNPFSIHAWYVDFDGISLGPVRQRFVIQPYAGERSINQLEVFPLEYVQDSDQLKATLIDRGKKFVKFATALSASYCDCKGMDLSTKEEISDKVIVDMKEYGKDDKLPKYSEPDALDMSETSLCNQILECTLGPECYHGSTPGRIIHDQHTDKAALKEYITKQPIFQQLSGQNNRAELKLEDIDYATCNYRLFAYKLRSRDWVEVHVDTLEDVALADGTKGFDRLVLPAAHKHIIKSQVKEHFRKKTMHLSAAQDDLDLVKGKGQGLIILLHGAPGVGKTCTAETIADLVHKPLYPITCGDLGSKAQEVEENLKQHFTLASRWDCVMLLDEADVFLAKRRSEDLQRNSIVSVFLRIMEYYRGLLFLTTNRVGTFDEAFKSRVHISLFYADFDQKTTIKVWKTFIRQTKEAIKRKGWKHFKVKTEEILQFAEEH